MGEINNTSARFDEVDIDKLRPMVVIFAEYKPRADTSFRVEIRNVNDRDFLRTRLVFGDTGTESSLDYIETRDLRGGRYLCLRLRKTFN